MHLRFVVWAWETILRLLTDVDPALSKLVAETCRPLAVDQRREGVLHVVLGCAEAGTRDRLAEPHAAQVVATAIGRALDLKVELVVVEWPGTGPARPGELPAILPAKAPEWLRTEAAKCETPLERLFLARAADRRIRLSAQHALATVRLDLAEVRRRVGIDIYGWFRRRDPAYEREHRILESGWIGLSFAGEEVHGDVGKCLDRLERELRRRG